MRPIKAWLLYDDWDYILNRDFASLMAGDAATHGITLETVLRSQLTPAIQKGVPVCKYNGQVSHPDFILSRQRDAFLSAFIESAGIPVHNSARVCELCNDKRRTHLFLKGLPMLNTVFPENGAISPPEGTVFPVILKPASSHGGDRVFWVENQSEWQKAAQRITPDSMLQQEIASDYGRDTRVYVLFGRIAAAVSRTAREGFISNFTRGGKAELHTLTPGERLLAQQVIDRFHAAGAPLSLAGIDLLYHRGKPVLSEVEDVVGSRMLYQVSDISITALYWDALAKLYERHPPSIMV